MAAVHTFMLAFSAPFMRLILLHDLIFLPLEPQERMIILQAIPRAYINVYVLSSD